MPELFMIIATGTVRGYSLSSGFNVLINLYFLYSSPAYVRAFKAHPISLIKASRFASVVASQLLLLFLHALRHVLASLRIPNLLRKFGTCSGETKCPCELKGSSFSLRSDRKHSLRLSRLVSFLANKKTPITGVL